MHPRLEAPVLQQLQEQKKYCW